MARVFYTCLNLIEIFAEIYKPPAYINQICRALEHRDNDSGHSTTEPTV